MNGIMIMALDYSFKFNYKPHQLINIYHILLVVDLKTPLYNYVFDVQKYTSTISSITIKRY